MIATAPKLKILHVAFTLHNKNIQKWLRYVIRNSHTPDVQIDLLTTADEAPFFQDMIDEIGGRLIIAPHPKNKGAFLRFVRGALSVKSYDVIHVHPFILAGHVLMQAFRQNVPNRIMHAHLDRRKAYRDKGVLRKITHKISIRLIRRLATHGVAANEETALKIFGNNWRNDGRWKIMPYGLHFDAMKKIEPKKEIRRELGVPQNAKIILQTTDFYFEKNHTLTLDVFQTIKDKNLSSLLVFSGQGPLREKIEKDVIARGLDNHVLFLGDRVSLDHAMMMADMHIMPSVYEQDIESVIYAKIAGIPSLLSDEIILSQILEGNDIYKLPLDTDIDTWQRATMNLLQDQKSDWDPQGIIDQLKTTDFNIENNVVVFKNLYKEILAN